MGQPMDIRNDVFLVFLDDVDCMISAHMTKRGTWEMAR